VKSAGREETRKESFGCGTSIQERNKGQEKLFTPILERTDAFKALFGGGKGHGDDGREKVGFVKNLGPARI